MSLRERFRTASNFVLYYGYGKTKELSNFDIAIIEPTAHTKEEINKIKESNTLVIAYISIIEVIKDSPNYNLLNEEDFIHVNEKPLINERFNTYMVSLSSERWRNILHHNIGKFINIYGYDGIFLDTIGNVELKELNTLETHFQLNLAVEFVRELREKHTNIILIQNNGLERLCFSTSKYIDGICWENPPVDEKHSEVWVKEISKRLVEIKKEHKLQILLLLEQDNNEKSMHYPLSKYSLTKRLAEKQAFLFYNAPYDYVSSINLDSN